MSNAERLTKTTIEVTNLIQVSCADLASMRLLPGDLFIQRGENYLLYRSVGHWLDENDMGKLEKMSKPLFLRPRLNLKWSGHVAHMMANLRNPLDPDMLDHQWEELFSTLAAGLWGSSATICLSDFSFACHQAFIQDQYALMERMQENNILFFRRALTVSSLSVLAAIACGYHDMKFLSDIYLASWLLDISLTQKQIGWHMLQALEQERLCPGNGQKYLAKFGVAEDELETYLAHPTMSSEMTRTEWASLFFNSEMINVIDIHHEQANGEGFPIGIHYTAVSDWEAVVNLSDYLTPWSERHLNRAYEKNLKGIMQLWSVNGLRSLPVIRVKRKIEVFFEQWILRPPYKGGAHG